MSDDYGTIPMFEVPEKYRAPSKEVKGVSWRRYTGARTSCDNCISEHRERHIGAFQIERASWLRVTADSVGYLCFRHGAVQKTEDDLAERRQG